MRGSFQPFILSYAALLALSLCLLAEDKKTEPIDAKKLVGKWQPKEKKDDLKMVMEFTGDGKMLITITEHAGKDTKLDGTLQGRWEQNHNARNSQ